MRCALVDPVLDAVVSVGMPGMLGMPGTKLGMLVAAGFSIFGGGGLRNVPTPPADQLGSLGGGGCRAAPQPGLSVTVRVPSVHSSAVLKLLLPRGCLGAEACWEGGARYPPNPT